MWRTGKWTYIDEDETNQEDQPPSPPWKLGQVPLETAVFKNGRRMSKRFEKLNQLKSTSNPSPASSSSKKKSRQSNQSNPPPQAASSPQSNSHPPQKSVEPVSPKTPHLNPSSTPQPQLSCEPRDPSKSRSSLATTTEDPPQSVIDTNSVTECYSAEPPTPPPPIDFSVPSATLSHNRSSAPPLVHLPQPPLRKFKPWEALKGIQTDGSEVAGDLKLIQEGHLRHQKSLETGARQQQLQQQRKLASSPLNPHATFATNQSDLTQLSLPMDTRVEPKPSFQIQSPQSSSSDLTALSSSLSDLSEEDLSAQQSGSSSMLYSESDLEDDCLPEALVRKVKRPSISAPHNAKNPKEILKWKRRKSALLQHRERKAALRSLVNQQQSCENLDQSCESSQYGGLQPPPYTKIKANVYPYRKPELSEFPPAVCNCTDGGCGEKCLNRAMFYLCDPKSCKLGQSCTNQPFNLRKDLIDETSSKLGKGLKVFYTGPVKGWGLKTEIKLKKDSFLIDYRGEIISRDVCYKRVLNDYNGCQHFYLMDYDGSDVIDAGKKGNCARFINHSCSPNLRVERFKLSGLEEYQFGIFTLRDIEVGEELCYDYGWRNFSDIAPTSNVRTSIRSKLNQNKNEAGSGAIEGDVGTQNENNSKVSRTRTKRRTNATTTEVRATAPTVQRCSCGSKGCKGFLGAKKLVIPSSKVQKKKPTLPSSSSNPIEKKHALRSKNNTNNNSFQSSKPPSRSRPNSNSHSTNPPIPPSSNPKSLPQKRKRN